MKVSAWLTVTDLMPLRQTFFEKVVDHFDNKQTIFQTLPHATAFQSLKEAGVDGIELLIPRHTSDEDVARLQHMLVKYAMPVFSIHQALSDRTEINLIQIERLCQIAQFFSASIVVLHARALAEKLFNSVVVERLQKLQEEYHVTFGIENMQKLPFPLRTEKYMYDPKIFSDMLQQRDLAITLDTTHLAQVGGDITQFYIRNKNCIVNIHLSDFKKTWLNSLLHIPVNMHMALGKGELPMEIFLKTLKKEKYKGLLTMEINTALDGLCDSARFIKRYTT